VNLRSVFCMFGMTPTTPSLTMQLTSGVDVFAHVGGQKTDTLSNYCDNIEAYDKRDFSFCQMWRFLDYFWKLPQIQTSNFRQCGNILKVWLEVLYAFCWKFTSLSAVKGLWKSVENWQSYRHEFGVLFFGTQSWRKKSDTVYIRSGIIGPLLIFPFLYCYSDSFHCMIALVDT